jgi:hypothetical protein
VFCTHDSFAAAAGLPRDDGFREGVEEFPMAELRFPKWQQPYQDALLELDAERLNQRILDAETAIFQRLQELTPNTDHHEERSAISDAISGLRVLKTTKLHFPDWDSK